MSLPLGGVVGTIMAEVGISMMARGASEVADTFSKLDMDLSFLSTWLTIGAIWVTVCNSVVCMFGCREKLRTRFKNLRHAKGCLANCTGEIFGFLMTIACAVGVALYILLLILAEFMLTTFYLTDLVCDVGTEASEGIIDAINDVYNSGLDDIIPSEYCSDFSDLRKAGLRMWIGSIVGLCGQIAVMVYWTKYSTLRRIKDENPDLKIKGVEIDGEPEEGSTGEVYTAEAVPATEGKPAASPLVGLEIS